MKIGINILITLSVILNSVLLIYLFGPVPFFLFVSIVINILLFSFCLFSIALKKDLEQDLQQIYDRINEFTDHLENVHSLEMYYGDQNLQSLIDHSRRLINEMIEFQVLYSDAEVQIESDNGEEEETTKTEE